MSWFEFDSGSTIGKAGSEGGDIVKDEEYSSLARITLEKLRGSCYAVTCGIYGTLVHTAFFDEALAFSEYDKMKSDIEAILCCENDNDYYRLIDEFVDKY